MAVMEEYETLMPITTDVQKQQVHRQTLFLVLTVARLPTDHDSAYDQILVIPTIPNIDELSSCLLPLVTPPSHKVVSSPNIDSSALASQTIEKRAYPSMETRRGGHLGKPQCKCSYCHKSGHTRDSLYPFVMIENIMPTRKPVWHGDLLEWDIDSLFGFMRAYVVCYVLICMVHHPIMILLF